MSTIFPGGSNIFIGNGVTQNFVFTFNNQGWQGDMFNQPQPLNTDASMSYTDPSISLNGDDTYSFSQFFTNNGSNDTFYNLETSTT